MDSFIGARIRARRVELGMAQATLADALGVTFQQVQKYEKGVNRISARTMWHAALVLKADPADFLPPLDNETGASIPNTKEFAVLGGVFSKLNPRGRRVLVSMARALIDDPEMIDAKPSKK